DKETHHIEIAAEGVNYAPGDSIGFVPENPLHIVEAILALVEADREKLFEHRNENITLFNLLKKKLNILHLPGRVVQQYANIVQQEIPATRMGLHELLKIYPINDAQQFEAVIKIMEPVTPRLYSVSSAPAAHDGELHITVARDSFSINNEIKYGLCSDYLCAVPLESEVEFYVHRNDQFRLPEDNKDVIMIGPGTGIAPFRSFLAQRDAEGAAGRNWLFFGDRHFTSDFLYQTELQNWVETGVLTRLNVAFSRDQQEKIYVQHKMIAQGADIFEWIEGGAHVYVCGAKSPMSEDVENTLLFILQKHGKFSPGRAQEYLQELKEDGRYLKDVY
ncbi:MAG TPA: sulfite reductase, partial [Chitinophagaceae bacterium]